MPDEISGGREALQVTTGESTIPTGRKFNSYCVGEMEVTN